MTYEHYSPEWLAAHCDHGSAFERAVHKALTSLLAENAALKENLLNATKSALDHKDRADEMLAALRALAAVDFGCGVWTVDAEGAACRARIAIAKAGGSA